jgi:hypothetical protein
MGSNWRNNFKVLEKRARTVSRGHFEENIHYDGFQYSNTPILQYSP